MTPPIRPEFFALCSWGEAEMQALRLRDLVDWYKRAVNAPGVPTELETNYLDKYWAALVRVIALREGVPEGWLSYSLSQLAQGEVRLVDTAMTEAAQALELRVPHE